MADHHPQQQRGRDEQRQSQHPDLAESRVPDRGDLVRREQVIKTLPRRVRALQEEANRGRDAGEDQRSDQQLADPQRLATCGPEIRGEPPRAEQQREPHKDPKPHHAEQHTDGPVALLACAGHLSEVPTRVPGRVRSVPERERALNRVRVLRHRSPRDRIQTLPQLRQRCAHHLRLPAGVRRAAGLHARQVLVEHLDAVRAHVDLLGELERDRSR